MAHGFATTIQRLFTACSRGLARLEEAVLCLLLVAMIFLACLQILLRTAFSGGFMWADPLLRTMVLWAGLFGAAAATREGKHIAIDVASYLLPPRALPWLHAVLNGFAAAVCAVLTYTAVTFVANEASFGGRTVLTIPSWALNLVFPIAFALITGRFLVRSVRDLRTVISGRDQSAAPGPQ